MRREITHETLDEASVRELATYTGEPFVTSLYLDVDGAHRPVLSDCDAALQHLAREARTRADEFGPGAAAAVEADVAAIATWFAAGVDRAATRGVAVFSCAGAGFLRGFPVPLPVRDQIRLSPHPDVTQLRQVMRTAGRLLLVLVDGQDARLVEATLSGLEELPPVVDPVERQVDTDVELGSWEHRREEAHRRHLRRVAGELAKRLDSTPDLALVLGGPAGAVDGLAAQLAPRVADRVVARLPLPLRSGPVELERAVASVREQLELRREAALLEELQARIGTGQGVAGLEATLDALADMRVATLVVSDGYTARGARCPRCGRLATGARECGRCGAPTDAVADVISAAVEQALAQNAAVERCDASGLEGLGSIGAIERY